MLVDPLAEMRHVMGAEAVTRAEIALSVRDDQQLDKGRFVAKEIANLIQECVRYRLSRGQVDEIHDFETLHHILLNLVTKHLSTT